MQKWHKIVFGILAGLAAPFAGGYVALFVTVTQGFPLDCPPGSSWVGWRHVKWDVECVERVMAIEFTCACGNVLRAKSEWVGRRAKCTFCGEVSTVPAPMAEPLPVAEELPPIETYDLLSNELAPPASASQPSPAPFVPAGPRPKPKRGFFHRLLRRLPGHREVVFKWKEPVCYRARLKGDLVARSAIASGFWGLATSGLLVMFGINVDPPGIIIAILVGAVFGLLPLYLVLFMGRNTASGTVKLFHDEVYRCRDYESLDFGSWTQWTKWPYGAIHRCVIVPGEALDKSFSVMLLCSAEDIDMLGVPKNIDLGHLAEHMTANGVPVVRGETIPPKFVKRVPLEVAVMCGVIGAACFLGGLVFYAKNAWDRAPQAAEREETDDPFMDDMPGWPGGGEDELIERDKWWPDDQERLLGRPDAEPLPTFATGETELVGGDGGVPFQMVSAERQAVVAFRYSMARWDGQDAVQNLEPLFRREAPREWEKIVSAREGYAVGGLKINAGEFVQGVQVVFMAIRSDGSLNANDSYTSDWIGISSTSAKVVDGSGVKIIGVHGRRGAVLDAVGLLTDVP